MLQDLFQQRFPPPTDEMAKLTGPVTFQTDGTVQIAEK